MFITGVKRVWLFMHVLTQLQDITGIQLFPVIDAVTGGKQLKQCLKPVCYLLYS